MNVVPVRSQAALEQKIHGLTQHKYSPRCYGTASRATAERASCLLTAVILTVTFAGLSQSLGPN
jgi:hypothetical protein